MHASNRALPASVSSFVGRNRETESLRDALAAHRLVSVVGPGGAGKSRLVLETLRTRVSEERCVYVALEPMRTETQLATAVAAALGVRDTTQALTEETIRAALGDDRAVLFLDGAEMVASEVGRLASRLLTHAAGLRIVTTSRRVLGVSGEVVWRLPPMSCPSGSSGEQDADADAVELFVARSRERDPAGDPDRRVVAELCRRLNGLPLAIELAASWTTTFSVEQILDDRRELLTLSGDLTAVLHQSFDLLEPEGRDLLATLSSFAGRFTVEDARAVVDQPTAHFTLGLRALVDGSWLTVHEIDGERRYALPETVREFGVTLLVDGGRHDDVRARHARHFADLAVAGERGLAGADGAWWSRRMRVADADLQDALRWTRRTDAVGLGLTIVGASWRWWLLSGQLVTGRQWLDATLRASEGTLDGVADTDRDLLLGRALNGAAILAAESGDPTFAAKYAEQALGILEAREPADAARAATILASASRYLGDDAAARQHFEIALRLWRELGDKRGEAAALNNLALLSLDTAELTEAGRLLGAALVIKRELSEPRSIALGLCNLSEVLLRTGRLDEAETMIGEALQLAEPDDAQLRGGLLCNAGDLAARRGDWTEARRLYSEGLATHGEAGNHHDVIIAVVGLGRALHHLGRPDEGLVELRRAERMAAETDNQQRLAYVRVVMTELTGTAPPVELPTGVTARQAEILRHVAAGQTSREIGESLHIAVSTVERHLANVYRSLGLSNRAAAVRFALEHGL